MTQLYTTLQCAEPLFASWLIIAGSIVGAFMGGAALGAWLGRKMMRNGV